MKRMTKIGLLLIAVGVAVMAFESLLFATTRVTTVQAGPIGVVSTADPLPLVPLFALIGVLTGAVLLVISGWRRKSV